MHRVSQPISVDVVPRGVNSDLIRIEMGDCLTQKFTNRFVISKNIVENIQALKGFLFQIANDGNLFPFAREDQCRLPGEIICTDEQIQSWVTHTACFTNEREPYICLLLFENFNGLIYFFL